MSHPTVVTHFNHELKTRRSFDDSLSVVAVKALLRVIEHSSASTMMGLHDELKAAQRTLKVHAEAMDIIQSFGRGSVLPLTSACELLVRHVSRSVMDFTGDFDECKAAILATGSRFAELSAQSRETVAELGHPFIRDGATVLVHGTSRVVQAVLMSAARNDKRFNVVVTECSGGPTGEKQEIEEQAALFRSGGIPVTLCPDAAVASIIEQVDMVLVGAEAVVESGGVVNRTGTFQIGIVCKATETPFYVATESVKFARFYPLNQQDLPQSVLSNPLDSRKQWEVLSSPGVDLHAPTCDYTPAAYITLLFTDLGVLTPAAVSDELIKLYQ